MNIKVDFMTDGSIDTEILTSIQTLCSTYEGTIPLDRRVGLDSSVISESIDIFVIVYYIFLFYIFFIL